MFGIIGKNGSGKSTLLRMIMGAILPDKGEIITKGSIIRLALGLGFDQNLSARDNIYVNGSVLGLSFKEIGEIFDHILEFSDLEEFVDTPIMYYSSGMKSRLSFAIAVHANAEIFLIDEFFGGVGDADFQRKSQKLFNERVLNNKTIVFVSHSMNDIKKNCDRILVLEKGKGILFDDPEEGISYYKRNHKS